MFPWHHMIDSATSTDMVMALVRDYLGCWGPDELAVIPERARPQRVKDTDDLAFWHQRLVECYCTGAARSRECESVRNMLHFFACALQKAAELRGVPPISDHEAALRLFSEHSVPKLFTSALSGANDR
jgi:hypothetical protein